MQQTPQLIADYQCKTAEAPLWHSEQECFYWSDIPQGRLFRYTPSTQKSEQIYSGEPVGGITLQEDGSLLLFMARGAIASWKDGEMKTLIPEIPEERETRFNDVIADPMGRVFCGTMPTSKRLGRLYRLDTDGSLTKVLEGIEVANGMAFTLDQKRMYQTDSPKREIYVFDYDAATGEISNRRIHITTPKGEGIPDGMTIDQEGYIWSARWDGGALYRYTPEGEEVLRIPFPAKKVSSLTFGGSDYTDIFITTAGGENKAEEGEGAGAVFHLNLGITGRPEFRSKVLI